MRTRDWQVLGVGAGSIAAGWAFWRTRSQGDGRAALQRHVAADRELVEASNRFYEALDRMFTGDLSLMDEVWSHLGDVTLMDPFGARQLGWRQVRGELERDSRMISGGHVEMRSQLVRTDGDLGYVVGDEVGENLDREGNRIPICHRATSVFRLENGQWKMVHHHTDMAMGLMQARKAIEKQEEEEEE